MCGLSGGCFHLFCVNFGCCVGDLFCGFCSVFLIICFSVGMVWGLFWVLSFFFFFMFKFSVFLWGRVFYWGFGVFFWCGGFVVIFLFFW